jgi:uncharacterized secreted protein with C-terminal beta-propeller domain
MLFLINNPWILLLSLFLVIFVSFMVRKIIREVTLNQKLQKKHQAMRLEGIAPTGFKKRIGLLASTALAPVLAVALVFSIGTVTSLSPSGELRDIRDGDDIINIYDTFQERMQSYTVFTGWRNAVDQAALDGVPEMEADAPMDDDAGDQGSDDYSETNVQVEGVDEMDNVITDGKYIYSIDNNEVHITLAYTQDLGVSALSNYDTISYIDTDTDCPTGMYVTGLYVDEDYLVVVGSEYEVYCESNGDGDEEKYDEYYYDYWYGYNNNVVVYVYDKQDDFSLLSEYQVSGNLIGTRKIGDNLFVVTSNYIPLNNENIDVDDYLPYATTNGDTETASYADIVYVDGTSPNSFTTFYALDLDNEAVDYEVILGDNGYNLYVSHNNMYLVGNIYYFAPLTDFINVEEPVADTKTAIQKIAINDADLEYVTTGMVEGTTLNQFSMDEHNGYLRIATTTGWWGDDINNRVFILNEDLEEVSRIENLGKPGETIRSVRFTGDYGYVVTFEQTDPFYVLNLSDVVNPFKEGELEIPGFSTYLQPLGNDYMLGIGFGDSNGGTNGLKISIYDISDKTNPVVFDEVIFDYDEFGWGWSSATYNHKDLLVDLAKGIIALPFSTSNYTQANGYTYTSGILVYDFDETTGLDYSGFITHEQQAQEDVYVYKIKFIDQYFYTVSNKYIKASLISSPEAIVESVTLPE